MNATERERLKTQIDKLEANNKAAIASLEELRHGIAQERKSYMLTLASIAKANGGEVRIPNSAIDSISGDDEMVNYYDWNTRETVFQIRKRGAESPSRIILPGKVQR